ncbi:ComF family protein [uncultured Bifidobacterium sp.]|uniref:ComF family protein n=1 Tax=uncultured Bifidobacterium sp. TaxID=165187 RepID=UPI002582D3C5|nr:phosphoribosyltransferase family protein [uncultured Bifidobacterium sp.]
MPDAVLCPRCRMLFAGTHPFPMPGTRLGEGYACAWYRGEVRHAVLAWKDHRDEECDGPFSAAMAALTAGLVPVIGQPRSPVAVVPAPSSPSSLHRRGRWQTLTLARAVAEALRRYDVGAEVAPMLTMRHVRDRAVQLHGGQRSGRVRGRILAEHAGRCPGTDAVVVDDIVTTGSTMRQCVEVLNESGVRVLTCLALAYTPQSNQATP